METEVTTQPGAPAREPASDGPETAEAVEEAMDAVQQGPDRDPETGQFVAGNQAATGRRWPARSERFWNEVDAVKRRMVDRLQADLGIEDGEAALTFEGLADAYVEAHLLRVAMFRRMAEQGGPVTGKGKKRAMFSAYLKALDRERRLALDLGLERQARETSLRDWMEARQRKADENDDEADSRRVSADLGDAGGDVQAEGKPDAETAATDNDSPQGKAGSPS